MDTTIIKILRKETSASVADCIKAYKDSDGNLDLALEKLGVMRDQEEPKSFVGLVQSYIHHNNKVGALIELHCSTEAVAKTLGGFARELCMQISATNPRFIAEKDVPHSVKKSLKECLSSNANYDADYLKKLIKGKMKKYYFEHCLLGQKYIQDTRITIRDLLNNKIKETGEKISISRFVRFQVDFSEGDDNVNE